MWLFPRRSSRSTSVTSPRIQLPSLPTGHRIDVTTNAADLLDIQRLRAWLRLLPPTWIVGWRRDARECVLARYCAAHGVPALVLDRILLTPQAEITLPRWARELVRLVDADQSDPRVTAREALQYLDHVTR